MMLSKLGALVLTLGSIMAYSQDARSTFIDNSRVEVFGGWNLANRRPFTDTEEQRREPRRGYIWGAGLVTDQIYKRFGLALLLADETKGVQANILVGGVNGQEILSREWVTYNTSFFAQPFYKFGGKVSLETGVGIFLSHIRKNEILDTRPSRPGTVVGSFPDYYKALEFGLSFRLAVVASITDRLTISTIGIDNLGLTNITNSGEVMTNSLSLTFGFGWRL